MIRVACIGDSITWGFTIVGRRKYSYPAIREIAATQGLELIDLQDLFTDSTYMIDGVHPQREGAQMLADAIYNGIQWDK